MSTGSKTDGDSMSNAAVSRTRALWDGARRIRIRAAREDASILCSQLASGFQLLKTWLTIS